MNNCEAADKICSYLGLCSRYAYEMEDLLDELYPDHIKKRDKEPEKPEKHIVEVLHANSTGGPRYMRNVRT